MAGAQAAGDRRADVPPSITIEQSRLQHYGGLALGLVAGLVFLGVAVVFGAHEPFALVGFGFFGVALLVGSVVALRRGTDRRLMEVGPDGIWLPEMGLLAWAAIREVRLEIVRGVGGGGDAIVPYRRLGVVPLDPGLRPTTAMRLGWGMFQGYARFLKSLAPGVRFGNDDMAPFGLGEPEAKPRQVDAALATIARYVDVVDAAQERARLRAPRWAARADRGTLAPPIDLAAIDGHLAAPSADVGSASLVAGPSAAPPSAVFRVAPLSPRLVGRWLLGLVPVLGFLAIATAMTGGVGTGTLVIVGALLLFLAPTLLRFAPRVAGDVRRSLLSEADRTILRVGPEGIWMPRMGTLPWDRVRTLRAQVKGTSLVGITGQIPRWGLFVEPEPGSAPAGEWAVFADELDEPFDDVVDLVRFYHPVEDAS